VPEFRLSAVARRQIAHILARSERDFGVMMRERYATLLVTAIRDVAADPGRPGSRAEPAVDADLRTYHLGHSRNHVPVAAGRVRKPRHALVFRMAADGVVNILGIVHDRMNRSGALRRIMASKATEEAE
jgi:toxin ParE1/3/4